MTAQELALAFRANILVCYLTVMFTFMLFAIQFKDFGPHVVYFHSLFISSLAFMAILEFWVFSKYVN